MRATFWTLIPGSLRRLAWMPFLIMLAAFLVAPALGSEATVPGGLDDAARSAGFLIPVFALLLVMSGFVSGTETAIFSLDRLDVLQLKSQPLGHRWALAYLVERPNDTLTTILILNNIVNVAISLVGGAIAEIYFSSLSPVALALAAFGITSLILIFGEVIPKCVAQVSAHLVAPFAAWPTFCVAFLLQPARRLMNALIGWAFDLLRVPHAQEADLVSEEELKVLLSAGRVSNLLEEEERDMILGIFELDDTFAEQIMIPRNEVFALPDNLGQSDMVNALKSAPHSRVPVYQEELDQLKGFILAKEVLLNDSEEWRGFIRELPCIPERMKLDDLLKLFRSSSTKIAAVVDEYGQVAGIVTIRDLLEEIVGDMAERHESLVPEFRTLRDGRIRVQGGMKLADLARKLEIDFPPEIGATAGGFVMNMLGHVPEEGSDLEFGGYHFQVVRMASRKVALIDVRTIEAEAASAAPASGKGHTP